MRVMEDKKRRRRGKFQNLYRASIIGVPIGTIGFALNDGWVRDSLFVLGGTICALGFYLGMVFRANNKKRASQLGEDRG